MDGCQNKKLTCAYLRYLPQRNLGIADSYHEIEYSGGSGKEDAAYHSLTIEHQEECKIYQGRTRLLLHDDKSHGQKHKDRAYNEIAPAGKVQIERTYHLGDTKGRGKLGKLCRLDTETAYLDPRQTALDVVSKHGRNKQQCKKRYIYNIGKALHQTVINTQYQAAKHQRGNNPHHLHAATGREVEQL